MHGSGQIELEAPAAAAAGHVVILHGFWGTSWAMRPLAATLRSAGFTPVIPWYESWLSPFEAMVDRVCEALEPLDLGRDAPVHFVGHSMGGLVARAVVARLYAGRAGSVVMMGTPCRGSELADFCAQYALLRPILGRAGPALMTGGCHPLIHALPDPDYPVGVIAGDRPLPGPLRVLPAPHDGKVSVAATHLPGQADHIVLPVSHVLMPYSRLVRQQVAAFLTQGAFDR